LSNNVQINQLHVSCGFKTVTYVVNWW